MVLQKLTIYIKYETENGPVSFVVSSAEGSEMEIPPGTTIYKDENGNINGLYFGFDAVSKIEDNPDYYKFADNTFKNIIQIFQFNSIS